MLKKEAIPEINLSTLLRLTWGYWGFAHLMSYFPEVLDKVPAAFLSTSIPTFLHGVIIDIPMALINTASLNKHYQKFQNDSDQCKYIDQEVDDEEKTQYQRLPHQPRITKCTGITQILENFFCFWRVKNFNDHDENFNLINASIN